MTTTHGNAHLRDDCLPGSTQDARHCVNMRQNVWSPLPQPGDHTCEEPNLETASSSEISASACEDDVAAATAEAAMAVTAMVLPDTVSQEERHHRSAQRLEVQPPVFESQSRSDVQTSLVAASPAEPTSVLQMPSAADCLQRENLDEPLDEPKKASKCSEGPVCLDTEAETTASATHDASDSSEDGSAAADSADENWQGRPEDQPRHDVERGRIGISPFRGNEAGFPKARHCRRQRGRADRGGGRTSRSLRSVACPELAPKALPGPPSSPRAPFCAAQGLYASDDFIWSDLDVGGATIVSESSFDLSAPFGPPSKGCNATVMPEASMPLHVEDRSARKTLALPPELLSEQHRRLLQGGLGQKVRREDAPSILPLPDEHDRCAAKAAVFAPHRGGLTNLAEQLVSLTSHCRSRPASQSARQSVPAVRPAPAPPPAARCWAEETGDRVKGLRRAASAQTLISRPAPAAFGPVLGASNTPYQPVLSPFERLADAWQDTADHILQAVHTYTAPCDTKMAGQCHQRTWT